jgi:hypothetical protein
MYAPAAADAAIAERHRNLFIRILCHIPSHINILLISGPFIPPI